ncbi:MAG: transcription antitermination factor NusB [Ilumatobacteraceae bacterium]|jgi:transcription antitermination protein NusB
MVTGRARRPRPDGLDGDRRTDARERALLLLYEAQSKGLDLQTVLDHQVLQPDDLTTEIVRGVEQHRTQLDDLIAAHATGWTIARMPMIDVMVMRIAGFELLARPDVPVAVVLDEAVELAKRFSTDDSGRFVNGVLSAIVPTLRPAS